MAMISMDKITSTTLFGQWRVIINTIIDNISNIYKDKADVNHAVTGTTYGIATSTKYGHVKISDSTDLSADADSGIVPSCSVIKNIQTTIQTTIAELKNIISSGKRTLVQSNASANDTAGNQIDFNGLSMSEAVSDANAPQTYGNIINALGTASTGGGQLMLGYDTTNNTSDVYYRSHKAGSGKWGLWRKFLYSDNPEVEGNLNATGTITGERVFNAIWNDYAEFFPRGEYTEPGDIIALDCSSGSERYVRATDEHKLVVGVHSDSYGHIIGGDKPDDGKDFIEHNIKKYIPVGLAGRVYVNFVGACEIGDAVVPSQFPGIGKKRQSKYFSGLRESIIGYVVEDKQGGVDMRKVKILIKHQ